MYTKFNKPISQPKSIILGLVITLTMGFFSLGIIPWGLYSEPWYITEYNASSETELILFNVLANFKNILINFFIFLILVPSTLTVLFVRILKTSISRFISISLTLTFLITLFTIFRYVSIDMVNWKNISEPAKSFQNKKFTKYLGNEYKTFVKYNMNLSINSKNLSPIESQIIPGLKNAGYELLTKQTRGSGNLVGDNHQINFSEPLKKGDFLFLTFYKNKNSDETRGNSVKLSINSESINPNGGYNISLELY